MNLIDRSGFDALLQALRNRGYTLFGPTLRDGAVVYDEIDDASDLPAGWTDEQSAGRYRAKRRGDSALFGYAVGPQSFKKLFFPPRQRLCRLTREGRDITVEDGAPGERIIALIGARACDLAALAIQDKVLLGGPFVDPVYEARRRDAFVVAVHCAHPADTCFCASMGTGPKAEGGFDLALTELVGGGRHEFVVTAARQRGEELLGEIPNRPASEAEVKRAEELIAQASDRMQRSIETRGIKELLYRNFENHRWEETAARCLNCANCTMVCPTCFCSTMEDTTDLTGDHAERWRVWDSCFTMDFSYIAGGNVRASAKARYRQWITHKLASWQDQFGTSGCVGCGRCITWCPVGIDITEEAAAIRSSDAAAKAAAK